MNIKEKESWLTLITHFLKWGKLLEDKKKAKMVEHRSAYFFIENDQFYKKGFTLPSLCSYTPLKPIMYLGKFTRVFRRVT